MTDDMQPSAVPADEKIITRLFRYGSFSVSTFPTADMQTGPDRDWYTLEIDVIPAHGLDAASYSGTITNRHTGEVTHYEARPIDFMEYYEGMNMRPADYRMAIHGEAFGRLMQVMRDALPDEALSDNS